MPTFTWQTAFVRQKTPHPKELKAKAHKLFGGGKKDDNQDTTGGGGGEGGEDGEVYRHTHHQQPEQQPEVMFNNHVVTTSTPQTSAAAAVPSEQRISFEQPQSFEDEDDEEVSVEHVSHTIFPKRLHGFDF